MKLILLDTLKDQLKRKCLQHKINSHFDERYLNSQIMKYKASKIQQEVNKMDELKSK